MGPQKRPTLIKLARAAGVSPGSVTHYLKGRYRPSWGVAKRLARASGINAYVWMEGGQALVEKISQYLGKTYRV